MVMAGSKSRPKEEEGTNNSFRKLSLNVCENELRLFQDNCRFLFEYYGLSMRTQ